MAQSIVPNVAMLMAGGGKGADVRRRAADWRSIVIDGIVVGERKRALDPATIEQLVQSFQQLGQLQPIGVKSQGSGQPYRLIYGHHRLAAKRQLREIDPSHDTIAAVIYPEDMPSWACELNEVAENLCRKELSPKEKDAHTAIYAGLLKKHGDVVEHKPGPKPKVDPNGSGQLTVTQKVAADLGISDDTVANRIRNAAKLAESEGVTTEKSTPEKMSGEDLEKVGRAALKVAERAKAGKATVNKKIKAKGKAKTHTQAKPAITITGSAPSKPPPIIITVEANPTPPITITAETADRESSRKYGEDLKARRDAAEAHRVAAEAQKPEVMEEDERDLHADLAALKTKTLVQVAECCIKHVVRVVGKCASELPREDRPKLLDLVRGSLDHIKQAIEHPAEEATT
jgi:hypothetical protein